MNASTDDLFLIIGTLYTQLLLAQRQVQSLQQEVERLRPRMDKETELKKNLMEEMRLEEV